MILLKIQSIQQIKPIKWEPKDLSDIEKSQVYANSIGNHPKNPEVGSVVLETKILEGSFDEINQVVFLGGWIQDAKLMNWEELLFDRYQVEIQFDRVFWHGLEYTMPNLIQKDNAIIGVSEYERKNLKNSIGLQKELLSLIATYLMPARKNDILRFAKLGYQCIPNENSDENVSHFLGSPKHTPAEITNKMGNELFHLATFKLSDFPNIETFGKLSNILSFYLRTQGEEGWGDNKNNFKIFNYENVESTNESRAFDKANNFKIVSLLDLPDENHSLLYASNFSNEERNQYYALKEHYQEVCANLLEVYSDLFGDEQIHIDGEVNKLFGYPQSIQNCVAYEAERLYHQRDYSDEIYKDAANWSLLLQVSPYCKWFNIFNDIGDSSIYYMIRNEDLEQGNFDNCQIVWQCT